jgi:predicted nucleic acid-binding protein
MSGFLLDTNVPSELVRPQPEPRVKTWVAAQNLDTLFISAVSFGEFRKGIILRSPGKRRAELEAWIETDLSSLCSGRILSVTRSIAERWGVLEGQRQLVGRSLNVPDGQIAATALEHGLTMVTRNVKDFEGLGVRQHHPTIATNQMSLSELPTTRPVETSQNGSSGWLREFTFAGRTKRAAALAEFVPLVGADMSLVEDAA